MIDLTTQYLGLELKNPLIASSSPLCEDLDNIKMMESAGAAAVVLHSLFEEQINLESQQLDYTLSHGTESFAESLTYFPDLLSYNLGPEGYLRHIQRAKEAVKIPIIASLNGVSSGGWITYAKKMQEAGADALELNIYHIPTDPNVTGAQVEQMYVDLVRDVKQSVSIPVAVKLGYAFSAMANVAKRLQEEAKADALVLFNRFYQPDIDINQLEVVPHLTLSRSHALLLRLHWVATLYGQIKCDLAVTGGVHSGQDVIKSMMAGAKVAMMTSALLQSGIPHITMVLGEMAAWMDEHEYESVSQMRGSVSRKTVANPTAFDRANYLKVLNSYVRPTH